MSDPILLRARDLAIAAMKASNCNQRNIDCVDRGDWDTGNAVTRWLPQAEAEALRNRMEAEGE